MPLIKNQIQQIKKLLNNILITKIKSYQRETTFMPFLASLIQDNEKIAAYSFIHSLATSLGMSIYEHVSVIIASRTSEEAYRNYGLGGIISEEQKFIISNIINDLRIGKRISNIKNEKNSTESFSKKRYLSKIRRHR
jgi:hypothetical protein